VTDAKDLRNALRMRFKKPAFTLPGVASLTLGIALNKTIFSVVSDEQLRPLGDPIWSGSGARRAARSDFAVEA